LRLRKLLAAWGEAARAGGTCWKLPDECRKTPGRRVVFLVWK
jgi:hypothetical protein